MSLLNSWWQTPRLRTIIFVMMAIVLFGLYLAFSASFDSLGFPLDDAWIHQTYARNFARNGRWEFVPGVVSGASTSPLWTILLAIGYILRLPYLWWAYGLGFAALLLLAFATFSIFKALWPEHQSAGAWATLAVMGTWPLIWAAASGMETLLFAALGLFTLTQLLQYLNNPANHQIIVRIGILSGLLILIRPDGLLPILLIFSALALQLEKRGRNLLLYGVTITAVLAPYFFFNWTTSGTIWPSTFYAKQAEYAILLETFIVQRFVQLLYFSLGGASAGWQGISAAHLLLLPGLIWGGIVALQTDLQQRQLRMTIPLLWAGGHILLYAWRLPLTFQHGRYLMAATPVWIIYGFAGWVLLWQSVKMAERMKWMFKQTGILTYALLTIIFLFFGAQAYARDVAFIENEMVNIAQYITNNIPEEAILASHDIGAIGYFAERPLLDLAGLISPEVVPYISNEEALANYVLESPATYLVTAPGWPYEEIVKNGRVELVYSSNYPFTRENGLNNMTIYLLNPP